MAHRRRAQASYKKLWVQSICPFVIGIDTLVGVGKLGLSSVLKGDNICILSFQGAINFLEA